MIRQAILTHPRTTWSTAAQDNRLSDRSDKGDAARMVPLLQQLRNCYQAFTFVTWRNNLTGLEATECLK
jgi:hypothetical protein